METKDKKKKVNVGSIVMMLMFFIIGGVCGAIGAEKILASAEDMSFGNYMLRLLAIVVVLYGTMFLQIMIHEAGHLVFGKLTGYSFVSYRIGSFMWVKQDGKIRFKRYSLAGTGGQCLMEPPNVPYRDMPYVLYNLGGAILNIIAAIFSVFIYLLIKDNTNFFLIDMFFIIMAIVGVGFALTNRIPMRMGGVDNDGYNAILMGKNEESMRAWWLQLKVNAKITRGKRLKDLPAEWFAMPSDTSLKNSMIASIGVSACSYALDQMKIAEAGALIGAHCATRTI